MSKSMHREVQIKHDLMTREWKYIFDMMFSFHKFNVLIHIRSHIRLLCIYNSHFDT